MGWTVSHSQDKAFHIHLYIDRISIHKYDIKIMCIGIILVDYYISTTSKEL